MAPIATTAPYVGAVEQRVEPAFAVAGRLLEQLLDVLAAGLAVDGVEEGVDHHVGALDSEFPEEALDALAGLTDQAAVGDRLVLAGVLAEHQDPRAAVEPAAVEDRPPLDAEAVGVIAVGAGLVARQGGEWL
jgi:ABC-type amino acid transport substrate-binding protein